ncbi:MAG: DUF2062 domain-containing protein [Rhizobiales bacterium]|nr:DUF2062 domain-containing protein [Hyphomicrobiales bacterium]
MFRSRRPQSKWSKVRDWVWPRAGVVRASRYMMHRLARMRASPHKLALGFAAGAFASFLPFIGLHFIIAALVAAIVRGNLIASAIGTVVGNPITFPFIWLASYNLGGILLGQGSKEEIEFIPLQTSASLFTDGPVAVLSGVWIKLEPLLYPMLLGGTLLGLLCAAVCYGVVRSTITQCKAYASRRKGAVA